MGLYDRDYTQADFHSQFRNAPQMRMFFPQITPMVKRLLIINVVVFAVSFIIRPLGEFFFTWFSVYPASLGTSLQLWRIITYQFLHSTSGFGHIFWNMLILFFFGPMLERLWGSRKFLIFYLVCGAAGGVLYPLLALVGWLRVAPLIGASGAILGMLTAGAILFPNMRVLVMFIFPVKLRVLAVILALISILTLLRPEQFANAGGEAAHLAGMAAGAIYVLSENWRAKFKLKIQTDRWQKNIATERNLQLELDRILQKVHDSGIHSLTSKEKKILRQATEAEQRRRGSKMQ
jgi:membrane associated rhomboid family serine protease